VRVFVSCQSEEITKCSTICFGEVIDVTASANLRVRIVKCSWESSL